MKIRFHKNQLRLRLSQSEVAALVNGGEIQERFEFSNGALSFYLKADATAAARIQGAEIRVGAPGAEISNWSASDREGIEFEDGSMKVAIEKDYQCLHKPVADELDVFPNPMADRL